MNEIVKLSLTVVIFGMILLYIISVNIGYENVKIGEINRSYIGKLVNVRGKIVSIKDGNNMFIDLKDDTGKIKLILWSDTLEQLELSGMNIDEIKENTILEVRGNIDIYRNEFEIIPIKSQIKILSI